jgi:hypothetical protein
MVRRGPAAGTGAVLVLTKLAVRLAFRMQSSLRRTNANRQQKQFFVTVFSPKMRDFPNVTEQQWNKTY